MKISIITVVYNCEKTIERTIRSVLSQSYKNIEYLIIDGASTDATMQVVNRYKNQISVILTEKDKGMYDALNKGIRLCTGDVVGILHADDEFASTQSIQLIAERLQSNPVIDAVYGDVGFVKEEEPDKIVRYYSSAIFNTNLFKWGFMPAHPTFFCYKKYFDLYGVYRTDLDIAADFDLLARFLRRHQLHTSYIPEMLVKMNLGGKSTRGISSTIQINKEIKQILTEQKMPSSYLRLYARYFIKVQEFWKKKKQI
ncbi:MAG: glycosyltransferase [Chitinophagaceae bacterium]|jgi:glycosyltransferase involved in cell wall biosynthesis|nr:glycosyltransferase [Chitinophagaceae bacterium]